MHANLLSESHFLLYICHISITKPYIYVRTPQSTGLFLGLVSKKRAWLCHIESCLATCNCSSYPLQETLKHWLIFYCIEQLWTGGKMVTRPFLFTNLDPVEQKATCCRTWDDTFPPGIWLHREDSTSKFSAFQGTWTWIWHRCTLCWSLYCNIAGEYCYFCFMFIFQLDVAAGC